MYGLPVRNRHLEMYVIELAQDEVHRVTYCYGVIYR